MHMPRVDNDQPCSECGQVFPCSAYYTQAEAVTEEARRRLAAWNIDLDEVVATQERLRGDS